MSFQEAYLSGKRNTYSAAEDVQRKHKQHVTQKQRHTAKQEKEPAQASQEDKDSKNILAGITFEVL